MASPWVKSKPHCVNVCLIVTAEVSLFLIYQVDDNHALKPWQAGGVSLSASWWDLHPAKKSHKGDFSIS